MKKVLMTADTVGGVWTYALTLSAALGARGVRVALATMGEPLTHAQAREARGIPTLEVFESGFRLEWMKDPWENVALAGEWLMRLEGYIEPDVVHLNGYSHGSLPFAAPAVIVGHSCVLSWWEAVKGASAPAEWDRYRSEVADGLAGASQVAAPTAFMLSSLRRHYDIHAPCRVIPNGSDSSVFRPARDKGEFVFTAGRLWDEAKNAAALEAVAGRIPWPVIAAGPAGHPSGKAFKPGRVKRLGAQSNSQMAELLARASVFALPAFYEPFGLAALEAGLSGAALVLGDIESLRETWDGAAMFVDPRDSLALAEALGRLISDRPLREEYGARARRRALEYTPERMAGGCIDMYRAALDGAKEAAGGLQCVS